jgi:hypothetical protein
VGWQSYIGGFSQIWKECVRGSKKHFGFPIIILVTCCNLFCSFLKNISKYGPFSPKKIPMFSLHPPFSLHQIAKKNPQTKNIGVLQSYRSII